MPSLPRLSAACLFAAFVVLLAPLGARADEPVLLGVEAGVTIPLAAPQSERFGPGGTLAIAVHLPLNEWLIPIVRLRGTLLSDGAPPADSSLRDPGVGGAYAATLGLRLRPGGWFSPEELQRANGVWIELDAGAALTGELVRPVFEVGVGYGFEIDDVRLGPAARFQHALHFDDPLDDRSAFLLTLGVEVVLFDRRAHVGPEEPVIGDRDRDGILDDVDQCPDEPEDVDSFEDEDGCPEPDNDRDGILDADDECPLEPEDLDGWEDADGCPELDNDRDGFLDHDDQCPNEPETLNGVDDGDGCPDEGLISMVDDRIVLEETVLFDFQRARVKHSARPVLQAIVELWRQHPEWSRVRVEGHADARGSSEFNQTLSERRARQVRDTLVELGMPIDLIEVVGHGATRPRDAGDSEEAHQRNRRVEFVVVARREIAPESASEPSEGEQP
ncbi:MAG: OmpA family protein [Myxococcota bacterium]|nr:OmpA family protein [Myxococcota bacterium]